MIALIGLLQQHEVLPLSVLARMLDASEATIRRDVAVLASQRLLQRTHGGARTVGGPQQLPERLRDSLNQQAKGQIALAAARMIETGSQIVGITGGSTTKGVLQALGSRKDLTIITNSLSLGVEAAEHGQSRIVIVGGVLRPNSLELVGRLAEATLGSVALGTAILGADGISAHNGLTTHDEMGALFHHHMITSAQRVIVVADSSKIGHSAETKICDLSEVDHLITDIAAPEDELTQIRHAGVTVSVVTT